MFLAFQTSMPKVISATESVGPVMQYHMRENMAHLTDLTYPPLQYFGQCIEHASERVVEASLDFDNYVVEIQSRQTRDSFCANI